MPAEKNIYTDGQPSSKTGRSVASTGDETNQPNGEPQNHLSRRAQTRTLVLLVLTNICLGYELSLYGPLFPKQAKLRGLLPTYYGLIIAAFHFSILVFIPLLNVLPHRISSKTALFIGSSVFAASAAAFGSLTYLSNRAAFLLLAVVCRVAESFGVAYVRSAVYSVVASQFPLAHWKTLTILDVFFYLGLTVGPILGGYLYEVGGFSIPFYSAAGLMLIVAVVTVAILPQPGLSEGKSLENLWKTLKNPRSLVYVGVVAVSFYYTGFLQTTLEPHLKQFGLRVLFVGLIFSLPDAVYCVLAGGWGWLIQKGFNPVMMTFLAVLICIPSTFLIGPVNFLGMNATISLIAAALVLKGIAHSVKQVCSIYGNYMDSVARGLPNDASTHGIVYEIHSLAMSLGAFLGSSTAGVLYDSIGFNDSTLVLLGLEAALIPIILSYGFLRRYRRPIIFHSSEEARSLLTSNTN